MFGRSQYNTLSQKELWNSLQGYENNTKFFFKNMEYSKLIGDQSKNKSSQVC